MARHRPRAPRTTGFTVKVSRSTRYGVGPKQLARYRPGQFKGTGESVYSPPVVETPLMARLIRSEERR